MATLIIRQKQSDIGTIYDLASELHDRTINMGKSFVFAVVLPSYYNATETRHKSREAAERKCRELCRDDYSGVRAIDRDGNEWDFDGYELRRVSDMAYRVV